MTILMLRFKMVRADEQNVRSQIRLRLRNNLFMVYNMFASFSEIKNHDELRTFFDLAKSLVYFSSNSFFGINGLD